KDDIIKRILRLYKKDNLYPMFTDQLFTPSFIDDLAPATKLLLNKKLSGIFHLASPKTTSQYEFACEVISVFGGDPQHVKKASVVDFLRKRGMTPRPQNGGLVVAKIIKAGFLPTDWKKGTREVFRQSGRQLL
ncbi:sugar nucleotide-binding protein, partial [Candidatus Curtissbacteria bacterium]|nr:sugar nucleotide-binding protein [Candidatus Curtissbacteria bacterium]